MAGMLPSFLSSAMLEIRTGDTVLAFAQNLSFTDDMTNVPIGGIGSYSYSALEPTDYNARGSMSITHYSSAVLDVLKTVPGALPANVPVNSATGRDGNSLLLGQYFNPIQLISSLTFDINIYERGISYTGQPIVGAASNPPGPIYTLKDCRLANLSLTFTPGTLIQQVASFMCLYVIDHTSEDSFKYIPATTI